LATTAGTQTVGQTASASWLLPPPPAAEGRRDAKPGGDLAGAGQTRPSGAGREPRGHQGSGLSGIHQVGKPDRQQRDGEEVSRDPGAARADSKLERRTLWQIRSLAKRPIPGQRTAISPKPNQVASICGTFTTAGTFSSTQSRRYGKRMRTDISGLPNRAQSPRRCRPTRRRTLRARNQAGTPPLQSEIAIGEAENTRAIILRRRECRAAGRGPCVSLAG
jgi:hypothetical protein